MKNILPIVSGFYISEATGLVNRRLSNMYPIYPTQEGVTNGALVATPGITQIGNAGSGASRGVLVLKNIEYRVIGNSLFSVSEAGVFNNLGTISGSLDVSMATNDINIAIQDPTGNSYFFTPATSVLELNAGAVFLSFGQAKTVTQKDGFYVYTTEDIFFSGSTKTTNDGKNFNALDFEDAEISPDNITKAWVNHNQLYIMGETSIEIYQTIITTGFPFQRVVNGVIQKGCSAPNTVTDFDDGFLFMGGDVGELPGIWKAIGSSFVKISDSSVDSIVHSYPKSVIELSRCWTYAQNGAYFAVFTIGDDTLVYDATASKLTGRPQWHARQTGVGDGTTFFPWRARHGALSFGKIRVGDDRSGKVGELDKRIFKEYGEAIERLIPTKPFIDNLDPYFAQEIELFMKTGVANSDVSDPIIRMNYSDDGGEVFFPERRRSLGKVGQRKLRVRWSRLGRVSIDRMVQFKISDPVNVEIYGFFVDTEGT